MLRPPRIAIVASGVAPAGDGDDVTPAADEPAARVDTKPTSPFVLAPSC
jgi:hypothetical protein